MLETMPKVLLHTHLEGSIPSATMHKLAQRNRVDLPFEVDSDGALKTCQTDGWQGFLSAFYAITSCFRTRHDFRDSIAEYGRKLAQENVLYAEVHCTPWNHISRGIPLQEISEGLLLGIEEAKEKEGIKLKIIADLARDPSEDVSLILSWLKALPRSHFVALGFSGGPESVPLEEFRSVSELAHDIGLGLVAHAGELEGSRSVLLAIRDLKVNRISHGVRSLEDQAVLSQAKLAGVHFELCPTSNQVLGIGLAGYQSIAGMLESGAECSINTDDELLFATTLTRELSVLVSNCILTEMRASALQESAAQAAFLSPFERQDLLSRLSSCHETNGLLTRAKTLPEPPFGDSHDLL